jgi:hypothetical protein
LILQPTDAATLLKLSEFRRFLFTAIQSGGLLSDNPHADGHSGRDLAFYEGRRSLAFEMLRLIDEGQPEPLRSPHALATLNVMIREALNPPPKENTRDRRNHNDRYDDIPE